MHPGGMKMRTKGRLDLNALIAGEQIVRSGVPRTILNALTREKLSTAPPCQLMNEFIIWQRLELCQSQFTETIRKQLLCLATTNSVKTA